MCIICKDNMHNIFFISLNKDGDRCNSNPNIITLLPDSIFFMCLYLTLHVSYFITRLYILIHIVEYLSLPNLCININKKTYLLKIKKITYYKKYL